MRGKNSLLGLALAGALSCLLVPAGFLRAQDQDEPAPPENTAPQASEAPEGDGSASFQTFYDALGSQGKWIQTDDYGYVWQPNVTDPNWAPYTDGHWVYTDDGWTWDSNEPWGWATYHYGRWVNLDGTGWCWVPGYTWAPAWVSWRYGDGYCGWAPLPPDSLVGTDYENDDDAGFHIGGDCDDYYGIGAGWYSFVPIWCLGERNYRGYYANRFNNFRLINRTTNVTNLNVTRGRGARGAGHGRFAGVSLGGPSLVQVNAVAQTPISRVSLAASLQAGSSTLTDHSLALFAPRVGGGGNRPSERPQNFSRSTGHADINRGTEISRPLMVSSHLTVTAPTAGEVEQAHLAQAHVPANANVATPNMTVHSSFAGPGSGVHSTFTPSPGFAPARNLSPVERPSQGYSGGGYRPSSSSYATPRSAPSTGGGGNFHGGGGSGGGGGSHGGGGGGGGSSGSGRH